MNNQNNWRATLVEDFLVTFLLFSVGLVVVAVKLGPPMLRWVQRFVQQS